MQRAKWQHYVRLTVTEKYAAYKQKRSLVIGFSHLAISNIHRACDINSLKKSKSNINLLYNLPTPTFLLLQSYIIINVVRSTKSSRRKHYYIIWIR